ncbi:MAG TPA: hypothetical protein VN285_04655 [Candidatus Deferrimicrobium sp.]|nr:hypothetical protein [Candidatus Deferrimicrobium sp.]
MRLLVWFAGGCVLFGGMKLTSSWLGNNTLENVPWYVGGLLFIIVELCVHAIMAGLKRDNFWNGRG